MNVQSERDLEQLKSECWDMIKSEVHPSPGLIVADGNDMLQFDFINGDVSLLP